MKKTGLSKRLSKKLKSLRKAIRSFEQKFEKRGYRSPFKIHPPLVEKVSLIVPTYNVEQYIEEFLASVTSQTTGLRNLEVIIVDDGSTDRSGEIAQAWARRFPKTIKYIRQENRGAAAARNTGLDHATGEWVSFPDPDDILDRKWLHALNREIKSRHERPVLIIARPLHVFRESDGVIRNIHPLASQYNRRREINTSNLGDYILLNTASNFFHRKSIEDSGLRFDPAIRPGFEDAHFVNRLIAAFPDRLIIAQPKPAYIYRKREAGTSLLDGSKSRPEWYYDQIKFGYLGLIDSVANKLGSLPRYVQRVVLYSLGWRFRYLINHSSRADFLTDEQRSQFLLLVSEVLSKLDAETIRTMNFGGLHEGYKAGLLWWYKKEDRVNDYLYLQQYDPQQQIIQFSYYSGGDTGADVTVFVDGKPAEHLYCSRSVSTFLNKPFFSEHRFWIRVTPDAEVRATINHRPVRLRRGSRTLGDRVPVRSAVRALVPNPSPNLPTDARNLRDYATSEFARKRFANCWVLMDRDDAADDNAEHLYRYLLMSGNADRAFFVLREDSPDWQRLDAEGFKLLPFGSKDHIAALVNAEILASSHIDHFILWPVAKEWIQDLARYKCVFLQHGVTKDDLSNWLNAKPIRLFVTAAPDEYNSIANTSSNYFFSERETKLTGFPRHDRLLSRPQKRDAILIMPTWRRYLVGETTGAGMKREPMADFIRTQYARAWRDLLVSDRLRQLAEYHGKEIVFCPHPNMAMYLEQFDLPAYIRCRDPRLPPSIQETFAEAALMVTDYSSVAFECAYIDRPIVYFQFDRDEFFAGDHVYTRGYFDYREHGFGPVVETGDQVLDAIQKVLEGQEDPVYAQRRESFFAFRDGRCCERVYNAILEILPESSISELTSSPGQRLAAE